LPGEAGRQKKVQEEEWCGDEPVDWLALALELEFIIFSYQSIYRT
jgi:hypothetical protein